LGLARARVVGDHARMSLDTTGATVPRLRTGRLLLREWRQEDLGPFAALNADPAVAEFLSAALTRAESDALVGRIVDHWRTDGHGLWAVERTADRSFLGFCGLSAPAWAPEPTPEIGWRLARYAWGQGYATEAARAVLRFAFDDLGFDALVSYTTVPNTRSRRVMEKLGMARSDPGAPFDFLHPRLPEGHPLRPHVTYRLARAAWKRTLEARDADQ
jgi:RimJ/RimL family protein N-acetyltransferase